MTRIAHVITDLRAAGAQVGLVKLLKTPPVSGLHHDVISLGTTDPVGSEIESLGVRVAGMGMSGTAKDVRFMPRLRKTLRSMRPDIVHTWMYHADLVGGLATRTLPGVRLLWSIHTSNLDRASKRQTVWIARFNGRLSHFVPDRILCVSEVSRDVHVALGYRADRMVLVPFGFETDRFKPDPAARAEVRAEVGIPQDAVVVGYAARFHPQKDHRNLVEAAALIHGRSPNVRFVLCGDGTSWDNRELARWIKEEGVEDIFHLLGPRFDIHRVMAAFDIVTMSSSFGEAFPQVLGEAMSCAVPAVVTDVGDSASIVADTGRVVPPRDPGALAAALHELVVMSTDERAALGAAARKRIETEFGFERAGERYARVYDDLLKSKRRRLS